MPLPPDHPLRIELNDEAHARPPETLLAPVRMTFLAVLSEERSREEEWLHVSRLTERFGAAPPPREANHLSLDLGPFRLKWERHAEFARYKFIVAGADEDPFAVPAIAAVPAEWVAAIPGRILVASHAALVRAADTGLTAEAIAARVFGGNVPIGANVAGGAAIALTDFRIRADGFGRLYIVDRGLTPRQAGRTLQRLVEIDAYRIMSLLALPIARQLAPVLAHSEAELSGITHALSRATAQDEASLLDRLTALDAQIEGLESEHAYRFGASAAYYELVQRRITELREERIQGLQTFREFTERRLAPAMSTCQATAARLRGLSERVARVTQLLSTRVELTRERQNQVLLESMDRRAKLQLHLQQTVEGLSVAAMTYYIVGLLGYAAKGLKAAGLPVSPDLAMAASIPVVAVLVALGVRKIRRVVTHTSA
jgi:uncharacterized membrane-anchored protein